MVTPTKRQSRRTRGMEPTSSSNEFEQKENKRLTREMKQLVLKGGRSNRINDDHDDWKYFTKTSAEDSIPKLNYLPDENTEESTQLPSSGKQDIYRENEGNVNTTYRLMNMQSIQNSISSKFTCKCNIDNALTGFINYCSETHGMNKNELLEMMNVWKQTDSYNNKQAGNITLQEKRSIGLTSLSCLLCHECEEENEIKVEKTKFSDHDYNGKVSKIPSASWYQTNVETVLATLACGMGASDTADFLSFLNIPKMHSFQHQQFTRIEKLIGPYLREVADTSMDEMLEDEIKATLQ